MKTYNPKVSIIIPVYNGEKYIREAIESALNQTYDNIEIIVINDGSTDKTEEIVLSYGKKIKYYYKENGGVSSALNLGIKKMTGEFLSWLSHDDVYEKDKISLQIQTINKYNIDYKNTIMSSNISFINEFSNKINKPVRKLNGLYSSEKMLKKFLNGTNIYGCCLLIHKSILDKNGFFEKDYIYIQDYLYWIKLAYNGISFYTIRKKLVRARRHKKQVSVTKKEYRNIETEKSKYYFLELLNQNVNEKNKLILKQHLKYNIDWKNESPFKYTFFEKIYQNYKIFMNNYKTIIKVHLVKLLTKE